MKKWIFKTDRPPLFEHWISISLKSVNGPFQTFTQVQFSGGFADADQRGRDAHLLVEGDVSLSIKKAKLQKDEQILIQLQCQIHIQKSSP